METTERWARLVGGNPALDFVNTELFSESDRARDVLRSTDEFAAWCEAVGLASEPGEGSLRDAARARTAIRNVVQPLAARREPDPSALASLRGAYADAIGRAGASLDAGRLTWSWSSAVDELLGDAVELLTEQPHDRVRACPNCGHLFLDTTKNGGRRWCSMEDCGKEEKMRRYVTKRAETRGAREK